MMRERRARVLGAALVVLRFIVMRQVRMPDQMHCRLRDLGHAGDHREQQRDRDDEPHV